MTLYFEDVSVGDELPDLEKGPLQEIDLVRYAGASGDFNPIHTVPRVAQSVGLDTTIAHGMMIMAYAGKVITDWAGAGTLRQFRTRFSGMTKPGEAVVCRAKVSRLIEEGGEALVMGRLTVKGKEDDSLKLKGDFTVALPRKSG